MPYVYINYSDYLWRKGHLDIPCVIFAFSSQDQYHEIHFGGNFQPVKTMLAWMKQIIPSSNRNYDSQTMIHTWFLQDFNNARKLFEPSNLYQWTLLPDVLDYVLFSKTKYDAEQQRLRDIRDKAWKKANNIEPEKAEDFFHQFKEPQTKTASLSKLDIEKKWAILMGWAVGQPLSKTDYRIATRIHHPDLNGGDGSKMSELNMLWQEYVKLCPEAK